MEKKIEKLKITNENFFIASTADFKIVENAPEREPDYISYATFVVWEDDVDYVEEDESGTTKIWLDADCEDDFLMKDYKVVETFKGKYGDTGYRCITEYVSSKYWYTEEGVYRESDHWGQCRDCYWLLNGEEAETSTPVVGFCRWDDFKENNGNHSIRVTKAKTEKQTIEQLALEVFEIIEGKINSHDFNEDDTEVEIEAEICIDGKDFGTVKFEVYQNILTPSGGGGFDEAPYGFEADYQVFDIETEIYNEGKFLPNVTKAVNNALFEKYYGKKI